MPKPFVAITYYALYILGVLILVPAIVYVAGWIFENYITMVNNLAVIDYEKCIGCGICAQKCPRKLITVDGKVPVVKPAAPKAAPAAAPAAAAAPKAEAPAEPKE